MSSLLVTSLRNRPELEVRRLKFADARAVHFAVSDPATGASGFGGAETAKLAQTKAVFEWIERRVYRQHGNHDVTSSSGWAAHSTAELARANAEDELLERDALLCSWLLKLSPALVGEEFFPAFGRAFPLLRFGSGKGFMILGVVLESDGSRMLVSTTAATEAEGIAKLQIDSERAAYVMRAGVSDEVMKQHHEAFCALSAESLAWLYAGGTGIEYGPVVFTHSSYEVPLWNGSLAHVCHAESSELQDLFYGATSANKLNHNRLAQFGIRELNLELHPLL